MKNLISFFLLCIFSYSCSRQPFIPISNTLELALDDKYAEYVSLLNKAVEKDSIALFNFLKIDYIHDAAGYDHGSIVFQLLNQIGDEAFWKILQKMDKKNLDTIRQYFEVGIDNRGESNVELEKRYPRSIKILIYKINF